MPPVRRWSVQLGPSTEVRAELRQLVAYLKRGPAGRSLVHHRHGQTGDAWYARLVRGIPASSSRSKRTWGMEGRRASTIFSPLDRVARSSSGKLGIGRGVPLCGQLGAIGALQWRSGTQGRGATSRV